MREHIGYLSNWVGVTSEPAIAVAKAIEVVMNAFFPDAEENSIMSWTMPVQTNDLEPQPISLTVTRGDSKDSSWVCSAAEIEAVLSLWLYSIRAQELKDNELPDKMEEASFVTGDLKKRDWLRHGKAALSNPAIRLLGRRTGRYFQDLRWYLGSGMAASIMGVKDLGPNKPPSAGYD